MVVLIFMVVSTTFKNQAAVKLVLPESSQAKAAPAVNDSLIVTVANYLTPAGTAIQGVGLTPEAGLRGPGLGLLEPPLPSAAQFDDAWDHRVCATK